MRVRHWPKPRSESGTTEYFVKQEHHNETGFGYHGNNFDTYDLGGLEILEVLK